jgi:hypothetical protein
MLANRAPNLAVIGLDLAMALPSFSPQGDEVTKWPDSVAHRRRPISPLLMQKKSNGRTTRHIHSLTMKLLLSWSRMPAKRCELVPSPPKAQQARMAKNLVKLNWPRPRSFLRLHTTAFSSASYSQIFLGKQLVDYQTLDNASPIPDALAGHPRGSQSQRPGKL